MFLRKFRKTLVAVLAINFVLPGISSAKVYINEVAWMGNEASQYGEWIELYNDSVDAVDLKDAVLYEGGGTTQIIKLTKSIAPDGYYLIARSTPSMPDPVGGLADDLGSFGGSGLSNSGEFLILKSSSGDILDSFDVSSGWPAGDSATKQTMQKSGSAWTTATGTPRALNSSFAIVNANSDASSLANNSSGTSVSQDFSGLSAHSSPADLSTKIEEVKIFAYAGRNRLALTETPVAFEESLTNSKYEDLDGGNVSWSFGDGQTATGKVVLHTYKFQGDYVVIMNVVKNAETYVARTNVRVVPAELSITDVTSDSVKIKNSADYEANLGGWQLVSARSSFTIPEDTIILPKHEVIFSKEVTGLSLDTSGLKLISPAKNIVSIFKSILTIHKVESSVYSATSTSQASTTAAILSLQQKIAEARKQLELQIAKPVKVTAVSKKEEIAVPKLALVSNQVIEKPRSIFKSILAYFKL